MITNFFLKGVTFLHFFCFHSLAASAARSWRALSSYLFLSLNPKILIQNEINLHIPNFLCNFAPESHENERKHVDAQNEIVLYQPNELTKLEVRVKNETVWLNQDQIAQLFGTKRPAITKHLNNIYESGELDKDSTCSILEHMGNDGNQPRRDIETNKLR